ncbi:hypothetical protein V8E36_004075 [Tilletia maclaganii]
MMRTVFFSSIFSLPSFVPRVSTPSITHQLAPTAIFPIQCFDHHHDTHTLFFPSTVPTSSSFSGLDLLPVFLLTLRPQFQFQRPCSGTQMLSGAPCQSGINQEMQTNRKPPSSLLLPFPHTFIISPRLLPF